MRIKNKGHSNQYACYPSGHHGYPHGIGISTLGINSHQSHKTLSEWLTAADPVEDLHEFSVTQWTGKEHLTYTYQYANGVPLKDGAAYDNH